MRTGKSIGRIPLDGANDCKNWRTSLSAGDAKAAWQNCCSSKDWTRDASRTACAPFRLDKTSTYFASSGLVMGGGTTTGRDVSADGTVGASSDWRKKMQCSPDGGWSVDGFAFGTLGCPGGSGVFSACGTGHRSSPLSARPSSMMEARKKGWTKLRGRPYHVHGRFFVPPWRCRLSSLSHGGGT